MCNSGLGTMSWEFAKHLKPSKVLLVQNRVFQTFPERYAEFETKLAPNQSDFGVLRDWITDVDVLVAIETPYDWLTFQRARDKGVKTRLITMCEMQDRNLRYPPDLFVCPSKLDLDLMPAPKKFLEFPVNTEVLRWQERKTAKTFIHAGSHGGVAGRKGTSLFMEAIKYVKSDVKFIIYSWGDIVSNDPRLEIRVQNFKNYWQMWREGDVLVYPQNFNGICLPIVEAMSCGLGVITTDIYPFNEYMPKELLFKPKEMYKARINSGTYEMDAALIDPKTLAEKIDEVASMDLTTVSNYGREWAVEHSWGKMLPKWKQILK